MFQLIGYLEHLCIFQYTLENVKITLITLNALMLYEL